MQSQDGKLQDSEQIFTGFFGPTAKKKKNTLNVVVQLFPVFGFSGDNLDTLQEQK